MVGDRDGRVRGRGAMPAAQEGHARRRRRSLHYGNGGGCRKEKFSCCVSVPFPPCLSRGLIPCGALLAVILGVEAASWIGPLQTDGSSTPSLCQTSVILRQVRLGAHWVT